MTFDEWLDTVDILRKEDKQGRATLALVWAASASVEREACAQLVSDLVLHRVPASEYADRIRERGR